MLVKAHTSIIGDTGYNCHSRNFFKALDELIPVQVRNYTIGSTWRGYNSDNPHDNEYYMDDQLKTMLVEQTLSTPNSKQEFPLYTQYSRQATPDVHIVLNDTNHHYFFDDYDRPKIAYNVWETTEQPEEFFQRLKEFDQVWVPTEWQKECTAKQGIAEEKIKVVPEGVDVNLFKPKDRIISHPIDRPFRFVLVGRWEYRKSTLEIIRTFAQVFSEDENVELLIAVDNSFATDGFETTEQRLEHFGISHKNIKVIHHLSKEDYANLLKDANVFVSCARSEGWNLPLIEAMACGIPSLYSDWGGQLEFAKGRGIPVKIKGEFSANVTNNPDYPGFPGFPGNFAEPDFNDLAEKLRDSYVNYKIHKKKALDDSDEIREQFTWKNAALIAKNILDNLTIPTESNDEFVFVTCGNIGYMSVIETLVKSLLEFSNQKILVYGVNCDVPFNYPNVISKRIDPPVYSEHDKWYWKQQSCIAALDAGYDNCIWIDGDVVANHNIDTLQHHFSRITNYPIPDVHVQDEFFGYYTTKDGEVKTQLFNELLVQKYGVSKKTPIAHVCLYLYNKECRWWFEEILKIYKETPLEDYKRLLQWNDEGIDNLLRYAHNCTEFLPLSNLDVDGRGKTEKESVERATKYFLSFWNESGKKNFGQIYGWSYVPEQKQNIVYFHGNKYREFSEFMTQYIKMQKEHSFYDNDWFYTPDGLLKNLGTIREIEGSTIEIAQKFGWDYAIYHEVYNLKDYSLGENIGINHGDTVVDLGGNIGIFTRWAYQQGAEKIITFEPDRRYFELLRKNAPKNAIIFNAAIGDALTKMRLTESEHLGGSNLWANKNPTLTQYDVQVYTLDYLFATNLIDRIDFLKVDIEGSEIIALNGISDSNLSKVKNIVVEYHHEHLNFDDNVRESFIQRLTQNGFNSYLLFCGTNNALQLIYFWR